MKTASHQPFNYVTDTRETPGSQPDHWTHLHVDREDEDDEGVHFDLDQDCMGKEWRKGLVIVDFVLLFLPLQWQQYSLVL